jgi:hypothetical protein
LPSNPWRTYETGYWPASLPGALLDRRTLEVRMDLVRASADDVYFILGVEGPSAGYMLLVDENEVSLWKYTFTATASFFWTSAPVTNRNVTVALAFTRMTNTVLVTTRVMDKATDRILFERSVTDGPGSDCGIPVPPPHGMTILDPDPGAPETTFSIAWAGVFQWATTTPPPPLEVLLDNLEYDVYHPPHLEIAPATNGVDLNWLLPLEEHIVVEADQLAGPWCPCSQPHTRTGDAFCLTMPCQSPQQFFKLTPGRQFTDDFSSVVPSWTPWFTGAGKKWVVTNGVLQVSLRNQPSYGGLALCAVGATNVEAVLRDFFASVDILDWVTSSNNWSSFALVGRGHMSSTNSGTGYFGGLSLNSGGNLGLVEPWILVPERGYLDGTPFYIQEIPPPYRLQFSVVGTNISFRVLRATTWQPIREMSWNASTLTNGFVGLWFNGRTDAGDSYTNTVDNFFLSGTK